MNKIIYKHIFYLLQEHGLSERIQDMATAKKYWEICEQMVKLEPTDPKI